ncbi:hypothetical protein ANRL3_01981 [Anaerolineae bacterium]|nr:hypothetical protein ANRL3_01981 [Anaerolineae bacterium]
MSRMYDRISAHGFAMPEWANPLYDYEFRDVRTGVMDLIRRAQVFVIDDVRDYMFIQSGQAAWDLTKDFPNLIPPFALSFFEMQSPRHFRTRSNGLPILQPTGMDFNGCGVLIRGTRPRLCDSRDTSRVDSSMVSSSENSGSCDPEEKVPALVIDALLFMERRRGYTVGPTVGWQLALDANGTIVGEPEIGGVAHAQIAPEIEELYHEWLFGWNWLFFPALLAISLLNRENARAEVETPPFALSRAFKRRHGRPLTPFYKVTVTSQSHTLEHDVLAAMPVIGSSLPVTRGDSLLLRTIVS